MKLEIIVVLALSWCANAAEKDDDESRPYEFGFTIDGQQHRHESKDVNGIIMGEFGFITADGVYHVTVYATDENGAFKIISMKNIKISEPLDTPGYQFGKTPTGAAPAPAISTTSTTTTTTPKNNAPYTFTTVPSLNVASCSSCKIPSTTPRPPGASNKLPFQTPAFQNKPNGNAKPGRLPVNPQTIPSGDLPSRPFVNPPGKQPGRPLGNSETPFGIPPQIPSGTRPILPPILPPINNLIPPIGIPNSPANPNSPFDNTRNPSTVPQPSPDQQPPFANPANPANPGSPVYPGSPVNTGSPINSENPTNPNNQFTDTRPQVDSGPTLPISAPLPSRYQVEGNEIKIPGGQSIPIKDPYPNMVNGLPDGITEADISDLLYKFNYTLGFHGHYEKGLKNGAKVGGYFVNGRDGISRVVTYVADENGYRPKVKFINLGLESEATPKEGTEKKFGLKGFEFVWYPI